MFTLDTALTIDQLDQANSTLEAGLLAIEQGQQVFDLSPVLACDSIAVAVLLGWQRAAQERNTALRFVAVPANLQSLAQLYGVADLLDMSSAQSMG